MAFDFIKKILNKEKPESNSKTELSFGPKEDTGEIVQGLTTEELFTVLDDEEKCFFRDEEANGYLIEVQNSQSHHVKFIPLVGTHITIGRSPECDVAIDDLRVSDKHILITIVRDESPMLQDLGSTNGTSVNGKKASQSKLRSNDVIEIGKTKLTFLNQKNVGE